ncbi:carbohydrate ABC transporter permease [Gracilibacillus alcaliphilus]|uniref:carbohydrate ABC transporter permease n=1 Tax=Gracilibacillus alcaliphilus TaxID=1401441 RepID=UPI00195C5A82|nr:sugar ABC transporter permease [Gracilibacillus alcaliphilus]MBM7679019.1 multiple sugar transport system permease protein/sn-glycerol 3-phosphate transport system permease protein [Gracilibacillus alcaliphilus]
MNKKKFTKEVKLFGMGILYLLPTFVILSVFLFYPIWKTFQFSFSDVLDGGIVDEFVGLKHYLALFDSSSFLNSIKVSFQFVLYTVPITIILSLFLAVIANEKLKGSRFFQMIFSSQLGISGAASSAILLFFFHPTLGTINNVLGFFGIPNIQWLTSPDWALFSVALATVWMGLSLNFILLLGGLQNISVDLYESSTVDGAGYWTKLFKITLPLLSPVLFFVTIINFINAFQSFGQIHILTEGGPSEATNLIVYSIYRESFMYGNYGFASAQAVVLFLITLFVTLIQFKVGERRVHYQ